MRMVDLNMNELNKYLIIKKLVESNGNKKRAAIQLNCTVRTINRLILKYKNHGKADFIHGLDMYDFENSVCFDEYHSDMPITQLLDYMNEYTPQLKCRYYNKTLSLSQT